MYQPVEAWYVVCSRSVNNKWYERTFSLYKKFQKNCYTSKLMNTIFNFTIKTYIVLVMVYPVWNLF